MSIYIKDRKNKSRCQTFKELIILCCYSNVNTI